MSLKHAILGFLTLEPLSGYDLKTRYFDTSVANFWPANQSQIYRTLDQMEQDGWVTSALEMQTHRPNRKRFSITEQGQHALHEWLSESRDVPVLRMPFLVQLYFSRHLEQDELLTMLQDQKRQHEEKLAVYQSIALPTSENQVMEEQLKFGRMTLDFGRRFEQMQIDWLDNIIDSL